mmetsp:Transcript_28263/g.66101  ORF Transcript_28263/g.66101 Transcript_28263/m.66101 type:complete len:91 (+) Transcript_28263:1184-1456(+)
MVRFARDCLDSMTMVCNSLIVELGPDTADLALRVGLHSGAVTAGVLRGQKAGIVTFLNSSCLEILSTRRQGWNPTAGEEGSRLPKQQSML